MKKYGLILVVTLLLIVSAVFNFNLNNKLEVSTTQAETLKTQLEESSKDNDALIENASSLIRELKETEDEFEGIQEQLSNKEETLDLIDDRLKADGKIVEKIDALLTENNQWREELNAMTLEIEALEAENSKEPEPELIQAPLEDMSWKQWVKDLQALLDFVDRRIGELEEAVSLLSPLSLERIMIQQEINFLETTRTNIQTLQNDIKARNQ